MAIRYTTPADKKRLTKREKEINATVEESPALFVTSKVSIPFGDAWHLDISYSAELPNVILQLRWHDKETPAHEVRINHDDFTDALRRLAIIDNF